MNVVPAVPSLSPDPNYVFKIPEYERYLHADAEEQLRTAHEELVGKNVKVRTQVGHGCAADEIVLIAKAKKVDLIVISMHLSTGLERWVFGSVAEKRWCDWRSARCCRCGRKWEIESDVCGVGQRISLMGSMVSPSKRRIIKEARGAPSRLRLGGAFFVLKPPADRRLRILVRPFII